MRKGTLDFTWVKRDFSNFYLRRAMVLDKEFTYGHYSIGLVGTATIGGIRLEDCLYYGVSLCSPDDNFSKKIGRENVKANMVWNHLSHKRGIYNIPVELLDAQPGLVLKVALQDYLSKAHRLPAWTKLPVFFRKATKASKTKVLKPEMTILKQTVDPASKLVRVATTTTPEQQGKRSRAAFKAWETRRKKVIENKVDEFYEQLRGSSVTTG